jgi:hypothetical protein
MDHNRNGLRKALFIGSGIVLVGVFLAWMVIRSQEAMESVVGMDSALGWAAHITAVLALLAGVGLLARGFLVRGAEDGEEVDR